MSRSGFWIGPAVQIIVLSATQAHPRWLVHRFFSLSGICRMSEIFITLIGTCIRPSLLVRFIANWEHQYLQKISVQDWFVFSRKKTVWGRCWRGRKWWPRIRPLNFPTMHLNFPTMPLNFPHKVSKFPPQCPLNFPHNVPDPSSKVSKLHHSLLQIPQKRVQKLFTQSAKEPQDRFLSNLYLVF